MRWSKYLKSNIGGSFNSNLDFLIYLYSKPYFCYLGHFLLRIFAYFYLFDLNLLWIRKLEFKPQTN